MLIPIDGYYTDKEQEHALRAMKKAMERQRALTEAQTAAAARSKLKAGFLTKKEGNRS
ncbi:hypothetical protein STRDD11_02593 [Streptococcus sp. DD11]|uniref:hypothetical protein n=1 Tax=Streptococcus sp. DD11 TaxID=1777879 RepID=UPI0007922CE5|nr:hypothetical protein [Streptococcus sp. DD11]KXT77533.1 hypothetical protein STRDD11_02593 [Streptococcus sp. DD11]